MSLGVPLVGKNVSFLSFATSTSNLPAEQNLDYFYNTVADIFSDWIPNEDLESFRRDGFFSTKAKSGLRMLILNSNVQSSKNQ